MSLISVIVPCYNQGAYLAETLKSVLEQTYPDWECIIVNDGSADNTENIALDWCRKDQRFKYFKKNNGGLSSARNAGLKIATGDFVQFLDADDMISPRKFSTQLETLKYSDHFTVSISDHMTFADETGEDLPGRYLSPFLDETNFLNEAITDWETKKSIPCQCFLIPFFIIKEHHLFFDEELPNHEDWLFWCKLLFFCKQIILIKEKLAFYRIRKGSMSAEKKLMNEGFYLASTKLKNFFIEQNADRKLIELTNRKSSELKSKMYEDESGLVKFFRNLW